MVAFAKESSNVTTLLLQGDPTMIITTMTSREFNQDASRAKKAAGDGPVFITDRGRPAHVLLSIDDYRQLTGSQLTVADALGQGDDADFEFDPPRAGKLYRTADVS